MYVNIRVKKYGSLIFLDINCTKAKLNAREGLQIFSLRGNDPMAMGRGVIFTGLEVISIAYSNYKCKKIRMSMSIQ